MVQVVSCAEKDKPSDLLTEDQMVKILTDIYVLEEHAGRTFPPFDTVRKIFPEIEVEIFKRAGVPDSVFRKSFEYYTAHPKKLEYIYTALVDSLQLKSQTAPPPRAE